MSDLLPCPFCGGVHIEHCGTFSGLTSTFACVDCGASCGDHPASMVKEKWNTRKNELRMMVEKDLFEDAAKRAMDILNESFNQSVANYNAELDKAKKL